MAFDEALLLALRSPADTATPLGPSWLQEAALEITALGGFTIIGLFITLIVGYLLVTGHRWAALYVAVSVAGGAALSTGLKILFDRPRPDIVDHLDVIHTASFPSGHAMVGTVTYLTLGGLLVRYARSRAEIAYILCAVLLLSIMVGVTRVYLGVHWPSDVIAGWALGVAWSSFIWAVITTIEMRSAYQEQRRVAAGDRP
jgi:undecaprenyl-diphosphatase